MSGLDDYPHDVVGTFAELADTLVHDFDIGEFLQLLVERCTQALDIDVAGVLLETAEGTLQVGAASSGAMADIARIEMISGRGPSIDAYRNAEPVAAEDLAAMDERWPVVAHELRELGMRGSFGFPLRLRDDCIGALNLSCREPREFGEDDHRIAQAFADVAAIGILQERAVRSAEQRSAHLQRALTSRVDIEQAKGMVAQEHDITPGQAFERLRRHARGNRLKLQDVCHQVVGGTLTIDG
jgi:GAF domain-containing protein